MATDYDAPRHQEDEASVGTVEPRRADQQRASDESESTDNVEGWDLGSEDLSDLDFDVVVIPPQASEFTCVSCFLVVNRLQLAYEDDKGAVCLDCAA